MEKSEYGCMLENPNGADKDYYIVNGEEFWIMGEEQLCVFVLKFCSCNCGNHERSTCFAMVTCLNNYF